MGTEMPSRTQTGVMQKLTWRTPAHSHYRWGISIKWECRSSVQTTFMHQGRKESSDIEQCVESGAGFWEGFCRSFIVSTFSCNNPTSIVSNNPSKIMPNYCIVPHSRGKESACNAGDPGLIPGSGRSFGEKIGYPLHFSWVSLVAQMVKNPTAMRKTWVQSLGWEDPLEQNMATHSSILAWRIPWTEALGGLGSMGLQRVGHDWATKHSTAYHMQGGCSSPSGILSLFVVLYILPTLSNTAYYHRWHILYSQVRREKSQKIRSYSEAKFSCRKGKVLLSFAHTLYVYHDLYNDV